MVVLKNDQAKVRISRQRVGFGNHRGNVGVELVEDKPHGTRGVEREDDIDYILTGASIDRVAVAITVAITIAANTGCAGTAGSKHHQPKGRDEPSSFHRRNLLPMLSDG